MTGHDVDRYLYLRARSHGAIRNPYRREAEGSFARGVLSVLLIALVIAAGCVAFWLLLDAVEALFRRG